MRGGVNPALRAMRTAKCVRGRRRLSILYDRKTQSDENEIMMIQVQCNTHEIFTSTDYLLFGRTHLLFPSVWEILVERVLILLGRPGWAGSHQNQERKQVGHLHC